MHACMHASVTSPDSLSLCHRYTVAFWPLPGPPLLLDIQFDTPSNKTLSCQSNPPSLSLYASVSPSSSLCCHVFPTPGLPVCGSWWSDVECGEEGGRQAGRPKRGCSIVPTHSINPPLICRSLGYCGGGMQINGNTNTQSTHTRTHSY